MYNSTHKFQSTPKNWHAHPLENTIVKVGFKNGCESMRVEKDKTNELGCQNIWQSREKRKKHTYLLITVLMKCDNMAAAKNN